MVLGNPHFLQPRIHMSKPIILVEQCPYHLADQHAVQHLAYRDRSRPHPGGNKIRLEIWEIMGQTWLPRNLCFTILFKTCYHEQMTTNGAPGAHGHKSQKGGRIPK